MTSEQFYIYENKFILVLYFNTRIKKVIQWVVYDLQQQSHKDWHLNTWMRLNTNLGLLCSCKIRMPWWCLNACLNDNYKNKQFTFFFVFSQDCTPFHVCSVIKIVNFPCQNIFRKEFYENIQKELIQIVCSGIKIVSFPCRNIIRKEFHESIKTKN